MRVFYDIYSSRLRAEVLLFLADVLAITAMILFATGAVHRDSPLDAVLISVWAVLPRGLAKIVGWLEKRSDFARVFQNALLLVVITAILLLVGWELIFVAAPPYMRVEPETFCAAVLTWGTGFLLFAPRTYRLHDLFLLATVLLALRNGKPLAIAWLPVFFGAFFFSCTLRHLLYDAFHGLRPDSHKARKINIQNARVLAMAATLTATVVFLGATFLLHQGFGLSPAGLGAVAKSGDGVRSWSGAWRRDRGTDHTIRGDGAGSGADVSFPPGEGPSKRAGKVVGFRYQVSLHDLTVARYDLREVFRVRVESGVWRPHGGTLWKAVSFSSYDSPRSEWIEEEEFSQHSWPADGRLSLGPPLHTNPAPTIVRQRVVTPAFQNFVVPYSTREIRGEGFQSYRQNRVGDVFPYPPVTRGTEYTSVIAAPRIVREALPVLSEEVLARCREIPSPDLIGLDLAKFGDRIFGPRELDPPHAQPRRRVAELERYFRENLLYSNAAHWSAGEFPLVRFLTTQRTGDCTYHATAAALLLRTRQVPTRLAVGFLGATWDPKKSEFIVRNGQAHAWVEVFDEGRGWHPVDPTTWVSLDKSFRPPPTELAGVGQDAEGDPDDEDWVRRRRMNRDETSSWSEAKPEREGGNSPGLAGETRPSVGANDGARENADGSGTWVGFAAGMFEEGPSGASLGADGRGGSDSLGGSPWEWIPRGVASRSRAHPFWTKMRPVLRSVLACIGFTILAVTVLAFLKPKKKNTHESSKRKVEKDEDQMSPTWDEPAELYAHLDPKKPKERVFLEYLRLQEALMRTRKHRLPHQTPLEHGQSVRPRSVELDGALLRLHRLLYGTVYGHASVTDRDIQTVVNDCRLIRRLLS